MPIFGKRSKKRMQGVDFRLQAVFNEVIKDFDCTIIEGLRSEERQKELLKKGATKTLKSKHLEGRAMDVAPYPIDWDNRDRFHYFGGYVLGVASQMGYNIRWGGDWDSDTETKDNSFDDLVHFEIRG